MGDPKSDTLVVGGGISGLLCATVLRRAGKDVRVLDKGRGPGGRMATRRMSGGRLDHGAQFFTVRTPEFGTFVEEWLSAGVIREWFRKAPWDSKPEGHPRYIGSRGMTDVAKALAEELDLERKVRLEHATWSQTEGWRCETDAGRTFAAENLVLTAPVPQSIALLDEASIHLPGDDWARLKEIDYEPSLAALLVLDGPSGLPVPGGIKTDGEPIAWIGDNTAKGISPDRFTVTVHSTETFAREHWETTDEVRLPLLTEAVEPYLKSGIAEATLHRWRYNVPLNPWTERGGYYWSDEFRLGFGGDGFGGSRVEGSAVSGIRLGRMLAESGRV